MSVKKSKSGPTPMDEDHDGTNNKKSKRAPVDEGYLHARKGGRIRFVEGKYKGRPGWLDTAKEETDEMVYVIIELKKKKGLKETRVYKRSIRMGPAAAPTNYEEACLYQHEDLDSSLEHLVTEFAKCELIDTTEIAKIFKLRLEDAIKRQTERRYKARWRGVDWEREEYADL